MAARAWPQALAHSSRWCFLQLRPGSNPVRALVKSFLQFWQLDVGRVRRVAEWTDLLTQGRATLRDLVDATERALEDKGQTKPPVFLIYIDQGEELYVHAEERQRRRFSEVRAMRSGTRVCGQ